MKYCLLLYSRWAPFLFTDSVNNPPFFAAWSFRLFLTTPNTRRADPYGYGMIVEFKVLGFPKHLTNYNYLRLDFFDSTVQF